MLSTGTRMSWGYATCHVDGEPLVSTLVFSKKEFVCVVCGRTYGFMEPVAAPETPKIKRRQKTLEKKWNKLIDGYMPNSDFWRRDCEMCQPGDRAAAHRNHATPQELEAHEKAVERMTKWSTEVTTF
jgi:hypothetical protein